MKAVLEPTKISEILVPISRAVPVDPLKEYPLLGIRLDGGGVFHRETKLGSQIAATTLFQVKMGDFIYSRLFAWRGAFGVIDHDLDGCYVSGEFPMFTPIQDKIDIKYLAFWFRLPTILSKIEADCTGSTPLTRNRFKENFFLALEIPLPPLEEQQQVVARIEELAARIEEARGLRREIRDDCDVLCRSILSDTSDGAPTLTPMRELVKLRELDITVSPETVYWFAGVYSFGKGLFRGQRKSGTEFSYNRLTRLKTGNFVYPKLMAWEGAFAVVPSECDGLVVSPEFPVFEIDQQRVLPETLEVYFHIPSVWSAVSGASTGTNVRRRRLNPADFLAFEIPLPPMKTQKRLREVKAKLDRMKQLQSETSAELDALLPSILDKAFKGEL